MADKLMKYYQYVGEQLGAAGRTKLAMMTKLPSTKAATQADTPEIISAFKEAIQQLTGNTPPDY
jgi:hypothetical protein